MRRLPWLVNKDDSDVVVEKSLKRKRRMTPDIPSPQVPTPDPVNSDSEETVVDSSDQAMDVMIPGYNNDDAYIMVEDDFLAAARQVTRHLHQEAYQRHSTTTVTREITRPTIGKPRPRTPVEGETDESSDGEGEDMSTLGELLRRRPPTPTVAATPIKRRQVVAMRPPSPLQRGISPPMRNRPVVSTSAIHVAETCATDDDEDDEDLDKPPKKIPRVPSKVSHQLSKPTARRSEFSKAASPHPNIPLKPAKKPSINADWIFESLYNDAPGPARLSVKRDKVSLAAQLDETSLKAIGKKKAISLKDQFRFLES